MEYCLAASGGCKPAHVAARNQHHAFVRKRLIFREVRISTVSIETQAEEVVRMVAEGAGKRNLTAGDLTKAMIARYMAKPTAARTIAGRQSGSSSIPGAASAATWAGLASAARHAPVYDHKLAREPHGKYRAMTSDSVRVATLTDRLGYTGTQTLAHKWNGFSSVGQHRGGPIYLPATS